MHCMHRQVNNNERTLTFSIIHTRFIAEPISTWSSPLPRMNASGTTTCAFTKWDITPVDVDTWKVTVRITKKLFSRICRSIKACLEKSIKHGANTRKLLSVQHDTSQPHKSECFSFWVVLENQTHTKTLQIDWCCLNSQCEPLKLWLHTALKSSLTFSIREIIYIFLILFNDLRVSEKFLTFLLPFYEQRIGLFFFSCSYIFRLFYLQSTDNVVFK